MTAETKNADAKPGDYRKTVFLPETSFAMKAGLPQAEPKLIERWKKLGFWKRLRALSKGREKFVLHDGPPYANGNIHIGTALNKILKDVVTRTQQKLGKDSNYVPGWDCHGLPIEWQIEQQYRAKKIDKATVPIAEIRRECRDFAAHWLDVQREEFKRLGVEGDWANPYSTMAKAAEAQIAREVMKFLMNGGLYRGAKPVLWSVVEKTALAEAEVEYHDHVSDTIFVRFAHVAGETPTKGASVVIWTTTPWTMPGNRAIAYAADADYVRLRVDAAAEGSRARVGEEIVMAAALVEAAAKDCGIAAHKVLATFKGEALAGTKCKHPLRGQGYDFDVPLYPADFVTMDTGTGFVHIAPGHGADDFELGMTHGIKPPETVNGDGRYIESVPLFAGKAVYTPYGKKGDANDAVMAAIDAAGGLLAKGKLTHQYPCSWRSKAPLIFRNTPQWFISMDANELRNKALASIDRDVKWFPASGRNRIYSMIENRPDWVVSRQRAWGVPLTLFQNKKTGQVLKDARVNERIAQAFEQEGVDAWFAEGAAKRFLAPDHDAADYDKVEDTVEVWFDSGSTHAFVLEAREDLKWPASLYLEGSDQHRGWFHSSLLVSCGTRGRAPYEAVLTHGFVLDGEGRKMSKSLGNTVSPQEVCNKFGADILRLWTVTSDYTEDLRISNSIIEAQVEVYRRLRNTLRYVLGNLAGFTEAEKLPVADMPELDRWVLHRLSELDELLRRSVENFEFQAFYNQLHAFCSSDLSAFYFDVRKDALYCDAPSSKRRRAARTVLDQLFRCLTLWLAPALVFTAEEAWLARNGDETDSVHFHDFPTIPKEWRNEALGARWAKLRELRRVVTGALELERAAKRIGSSLQAKPTIHAGGDWHALGASVDLAELCIVSDVTLGAAPAPTGAFTLAEVEGIAVVPGLAEGHKCARCWQVLPEVGKGRKPDLCRRCDDAVAG